MSAIRGVSLALVALCALSASCLAVQDFSGRKGPPGSVIGEVPDAPADATWRWEWVNPVPTGRTLFGIGGTSDSDLWVAGEGGTVSHFDGSAWDVRHLGPATTRYFSVGTRSPSDVWVVGSTDGQIGAVHYDGKEWLDSYPFAGAKFGGFSHGTGNRLFAVVEWQILELSAAGTWEKTDTRDNDVFGAPVDVWVSPTGEAWALTSGARLMRLPAGSQKWALQAPVPGVGSQVVGIALSGAGSHACAFYTGISTGAGFLHYDGSAWKAGPTSTEPLTIDVDPHGSKSACLDDGTGLLVDDDLVVEASESSAPAARMPADFRGERFLGALSLDGSKAYAVGALGAFLTRGPSPSSAWAERGPTIRKDLLSVDVGLDGTVMLVDTLEVDRSSGGEVLVWQEGGLSTPKSVGFGPPRSPVAVAVIASDDAWVVSDANSTLSVAHWTGAWGVNRALGSIGSEALAIWAAGANDVWITGRSRCPAFDRLPDGTCSKPMRAYAWHYDGSAWEEISVDAIYRSIHGTGPKDVWFAGDGVAHWDGTSLSTVPSLSGTFAGVWSSAPDRVWLWGEKALLFDGTTSTPIKTALNASAEWTVDGIAESSAGDVFVLTRRGSGQDPRDPISGTSLLWFDPSRTRLKEQVTSDLELTMIRGRGDQLWAVGRGGASLRFSPPAPR